MGKIMAIRTFPWRMDMGASADTKFAINRTQFGDGYAQLSSVGINNKSKSWTGTKTGKLGTVIEPMMAFIDDHAGAIPFTWTDPHSKTSQYTCAGYSTPQRKGDFWQITLIFEQFTSP